MNIEEFREFCLSLPAVTEGFPFNESTLVFKVQGKMFALTSLNRVFSINLKCDPDKAILLREQYPVVRKGYHMNPRHWITILMDGSLPDKLAKEWIQDSYNLVVAKLPKKLKEGLKNK